jgi:hypothetical protein
MKVLVIRIFRVPDCDTRITRNKFGFFKLLPEIPEQNSGFGYFGFGFGYSGFGFRVMGFLPSPTQTVPRLSLYSRKLRPRHASSSATSPFPLPRTPDSPTSSSLPLIKPLSRAARLAVARRDSTLLTSPEQPLEPPRIRTPSSPPRPRRPSRRLPSHDVRACRSSASPRPPREQRRAETERRHARASLALDVPARAATPGSSPRPRHRLARAASPVATRLGILSRARRARLAFGHLEQPLGRCVQVLVMPNDDAPTPPRVVKLVAVRRSPRVSVSLSRLRVRVLRLSTCCRSCHCCCSRAKARASLFARVSIQ